MTTKKKRKYERVINEIRSICCNLISLNVVVQSFVLSLIYEYEIDFIRKR